MHRSIFFSPSGEYYYGQAGYGPQENVYSSRFDQPLKATSRTLSSLNGFRPIGWAPDADLLLLEGSRGRGRDAVSVLMVYDAASDISVDVSKDVAAWGARRLARRSTSFLARLFVLPRLPVFVRIGG